LREVHDPFKHRMDSIKDLIFFKDVL
jgi:hypothetical protein